MLGHDSRWWLADTRSSMITLPTAAHAVSKNSAARLEPPWGVNHSLEEGISCLSDANPDAPGSETWSLYLPVVAFCLVDRGVVSGYHIGVLHICHSTVGNRDHPRHWLHHPSGNFIPSQAHMAGHPAKLHMAAPCRKPLTTGEKTDEEVFIVPWLKLLSNLLGESRILIEPHSCEYFFIVCFLVVLEDLSYENEHRRCSLYKNIT